MTDEQADAEPRTIDPLTAMLDRPLTELTVDEIMALKEEFAKRGVRIYNCLWHLSTPDLVALATPVAIYSKAFLETLAKHHADAVADLLRTRSRKKGATTEVQISIDGGTSAALVVTGGMPDEARLALLDLDPTSDELRGKVLRWDSSVSAWRPDPDQ